MQEHSREREDSEYFRRRGVEVECPWLMHAISTTQKAEIRPALGK
jgi:hypothetical protein